MVRGNKQHAIDRSKLAKAAKPLGSLITATARARRTGVSVPPVPTVSAPAPRTRKRSGGSKREAVVLRDCLKLLHKAGIFAYRQNTGTLWANGQPVSFGYPGAGDITGILPGGRRLEVECKSATGRQSAKQKKFQAKIEANGGLYLLARSADDLERGLGEYLC